MNDYNSQSQSDYQKNYLSKNDAEQLTDTKKSEKFANTPPLGGGASFSFQEVKIDEVDESLRRPRSQTYMDAINMIDMLSSTDEEIIERLKEVLDEDLIEEFSDKSVEEILEEIRLSIQEELESKKLPEEEKLVGVISKCYIDGCYVHSITPTGGIAAHYTKNGEDIPTMLEPARMLYKKINGNCSCIEVYTNCCRIIAKDGTVKTVLNGEI